MTNQPSPDMGQSVSDAQVEAAAEAMAWDKLTPLGRESCDWLRDFSESERRDYRVAAKVALLAAERLRAPVGGDELSPDEIQEIAERHSGHGYVTLTCKERNQLLAMARVRCAIPDGWRIVPEQPTDEMMNAACSQIGCEGMPFTDKDVLVAYSAMLSSAPTLRIAKGKT